MSDEKPVEEMEEPEGVYFVVCANGKHCSWLGYAGSDWEDAFNPSCFRSHADENVRSLDTEPYKASCGPHRVVEYVAKENMEKPAPKKREYDLQCVRLSTAALAAGVAEGDDRLQLHITAWLNKRGAEGFRLIRAEADSSGWMWLLMERAE